MSEPPEQPRPPEPARARQRVVDAFAHAARVARDMGELKTHLGDAAGALGFDHFLLQEAGGSTWLADLPAGWQAGIAPQADAVLAAACVSYAPFLWSDIARLVTLSPAQRDFLEAAHAAGTGAAVTVPIHRQRGAQEQGSYSVFAGSCSFLMKTGAPLPLASLAAAHYVGALAFDAAETRLRAPGPRELSGPVLTPRQHACVALAAQGKSDWEIGQVLGISESTVHKHIEDAKRRFGVSTRIQLVVRSLFDAGLRFSDVMTDEL